MTDLQALIETWREDAVATYKTWFLWDDRLKNFRSIRRGIAQVVAEIGAGTFGNAYRGSSLETVVGSIAEQRQIFKGADHAFLWKPKLRIPDIYEDRDNQSAFGRFLDACACCSTEASLIGAIRRLSEHNIKGLGPAAANLLYFLHPTLAPPFNTAIVRGFNALTGARVKLGSWDQYLAMREGMLRLNAEHRALLSNDLGALAGLLFDVGSGRYGALPGTADAHATSRWEADLERVRASVGAAVRARDREQAADSSHTEVQGWLRDLGRSLGFDVWVAANDRSRAYQGSPLGDGCLRELPAALADLPGAEAVRLIDVMWLSPATANVEAAFEVEHTTSIYSGIVRMLDLALAVPGEPLRGLFLVAPDEREEAVRTQLKRPAFRSIANLAVRYLPYSELAKNREAMARFGHGLKPIEAAARRLT